MEQLCLFSLLFKLFKREIYLKKLTTLFVTLLFLVLNSTAFAQIFFDKNFTGKQTEHYADGQEVKPQEVKSEEHQ